MEENPENTPVEEVKETTPEKTEDTPKEESKTIGDVMGESEEKEELKTVGLDKFLEEKKARKALEKELKDLKIQIESGATKEEISESLLELSEEYPDVDPKFLSKLVKTVKAEAQKEIESKLKPIEEKERKEKVQAIFKKGFSEALEEMPEYTKVVNEDVIFKLSLLPENRKKTFSQLIEETYSNALGGKRTLETNTPRGGKEPESLDINRAKTDLAYFKEIMDNPKLKKEYNELLVQDKI